MVRIYKYEIMDVQGNQSNEIMLPVGARVLSAGTQRGVTCIWAMVSDTEVVKEMRLFVVLGTGHVCGDGVYRHIGTVMDGPFVWHVFEVTTLEGEKL